MKVSLQNYNSISIPTYVINLPERQDRKRHIEKEFYGREEFDLRIVKAVKNSIGAIGLWKSIRRIIKETYIKGEDDVIIICEDDHFFTKAYQRDHFLSQVIRASQLGTHILYGGVHGFGNAVLVEEGFFWFDWNFGTQFLVVFRPAFKRILDSRFSSNDVADLFLSSHLPNKLVVFPFISKQKEFGYSDVTVANNQKGHMSFKTNRTEERLTKYLSIMKRYNIH